MVDHLSGQNLVPSGQLAFVRMASEVLSCSSDAALTAFLKLRSYMQADSKMEELYKSAQAGTLSVGVDDLIERVRDGVLRWDLGAILRQVLMPISSGYLGYAGMIMAGFTGAVPLLVGLLVGAVIYLALAPGTWRMLQTRISATVEQIFQPVGL